jgi:hypothetical protein
LIFSPTVTDKTDNSNEIWTKKSKKTGVKLINSCFMYPGMTEMVLF